MLCGGGTTIRDNYTGAVELLVGLVAWVRVACHAWGPPGKLGLLLLLTRVS